jgi:hypothetical protein
MLYEAESTEHGSKQIIRIADPSANQINGINELNDKNEHNDINQRS